MSTLEYTVSMLETMPEEKMKEVQNYIRYLAFRDEGEILLSIYLSDYSIANLYGFTQKCL